MTTTQFADRVSRYASTGQPFLFIIDFEIQQPLVYRLDEAEENGVFYDINGHRNGSFSAKNDSIDLQSDPIDKKYYSERFNKVIGHLKNGDTYLLNLTFPTPVRVNLSLEQIFQNTQAPYKLLIQDRFVVFSPECFIKTKNDHIFTYPMKGTIDASIENAENLLLNNRKEIWEHNTIVDLMRNDLAMISENVKVTNYRYIEKIKTLQTDILQTSSEIRGKLPDNWRQDMGYRLLKLLPAGSVSGAPKQKTVEIIRAVESGPRGYYSGVFGIYDGKNIDSAVLIRYIEKKGDRLFFRSGGGITAQSRMEDEYKELIQKIYVPVI